MSGELERWGITEVFDDLRGVVIETKVTTEVTTVKRRASFTVECVTCGPAPHVSPDDHSIAVCLLCGKDRWL